MAGRWELIPEVVPTSTTCDAADCGRLAHWVYVGDSGEIWACDAHHAAAIQ